MAKSTLSGAFSMFGRCPSRDILCNPKPKIDNWFVGCSNDPAWEVWKYAVPRWVVNAVTNVTTPGGVVESTSKEWVSVSCFMNFLKEAGPFVVIAGRRLYVDVENDVF